MALPAPSCPVCQKTQGPKCQGCKVVFYCSRDHQVSDRDTHKKACNGIKKAQLHFDKEEQRLREFQGDFMTEAYPLENSVVLINALLMVDTPNAVQSALDHVMDCFRLCRCDNMGIRSMAPALFLRLDRDQECYDFVKWWNVGDPDGSYDWGNMDLPYLDIKDADVFESVYIFVHKYGELNHVIAITLLKIRLLNDLKSLQNSLLVGVKVPQEVLDSIRQRLTAKSPIGRRPDIIDNNDNTALIEILGEQVKQLYSEVNSKNTHFWKHLLKPGDHLNAEPQTYSMGSVPEMQLALIFSYKSWVETPGAMDTIKKLMVA